MSIEFSNIEAAPGGYAFVPAEMLADYAFITSVAARMTVPVWIFDIERSKIAWANASALGLWRADSLEELRTRDFAAGMSVTVAKKLRQYQAAFERSDAKFSEIWTHYPKGVPSTIHVVYRGITLPDGRTAMLCEGGGEVKETPDKLRSAEALVHTSVMITLHDDDGAILYRNPAANTMAVEGTADIDRHFVNSADLRQLREQLAAAGEAQFVAEVYTSAGKRWHEVTARHCTDPVTGNQACLWSEVDVTEIKQAEARALHDACHDSLTKLPNRTSVQTVFEERMQALISEAREVALLFIDLDRFKTVNDSLGHTCGDQLLVEVADRLTRIVAGYGMVARLGSDEFLILLELVPGGHSLSQFVQELQELLRQPIVLGEHALRLTSSIGISVAPTDGRDVATLMKNADTALHEGKRAGRDRSTLFTAQFGHNALARMNMENDLQRDFEDGKLKLFYQPRVCVQTGRIVSAEVLLRWPQASGFISPAIFIPLAEDSGLIVELGAWVLREAARQQVAWKCNGHPIRLSVNVSARQMAGEDFLAVATNAVAQAQADPADIELEITERLMLDGSSCVVEVLRALKRTGFRISVDDFGTGYSNLAELHRFPIDCLKIDRSFVSNLANHGPLTSLIINMCQLMNFHIVAEGVETTDQLAWLLDRKCDEYQGFLFSPAISAEEFESLLNSQ